MELGKFFLLPKPLQIFFLEARTHCLALVWDISRKQWKTLQQQEDHEHRALTESILHVGATREVEAVQAGS